LIATTAVQKIATAVKAQSLPHAVLWASALGIVTQHQRFMATIACWVTMRPDISDVNFRIVDNAHLTQPT
jgi:hypothetical protein